MTIKLFILTTLVSFMFYSCSKRQIQKNQEQTPTGDSIKIGPNGGNYTFSDGIILNIPPGSITEELEISIHLVNKNDVSMYALNKQGFSKENLLFYIEGKPDSIFFNKPIKVKIPVHFSDNEIPLIFEVINDTSYIIASDMKFEINAIDNELIIYATHFSSFFGEIISNLKSLLGNPECKNSIIMQSEKDYICNTGECQICESKLVVSYKDCPNAEEFIIREVTGNCMPELELLAEKYVVQPNEKTEIYGIVSLSCEPLKGQPIDFSNFGSPASIYPTYNPSDENGLAISTFAAGEEEGMVTVIARSTASYYSYYLYASDANTKEIEFGQHFTKELKQNIEIKIEKPIESWSGTMIFDEKYTMFDPWMTLVLWKQLSHYDIDFQFNVFKEDLSGFRGIIGMATATANIEMISDPCIHFRDFNIPSQINLVLSGNILPNTDSISLFIEDEDSRPLNCTICFDASCTPDRSTYCDKFPLPIGLIIPNYSFSGKGITITGGVLLIEGTYFGTFSRQAVQYEETYSVTLSEDN